MQHRQIKTDVNKWYILVVIVNVSCVDGTKNNISILFACDFFMGHAVA
jgi:hypothetical protein